MNVSISFFTKNNWCLFYEAQFDVEIFVSSTLYAFVTSLLLCIVKIHYLLLHKFYHSCVLLTWLPTYFISHLILICSIFPLIYLKYIFKCYSSLITVYGVLIVFNLKFRIEFTLYPVPSNLYGSMNGRRGLQLL